MSTHLRALLRYVLVASAIVTLVAMRQISAMIGRIELSGRSASMSVFTAPHWPAAGPLREITPLWAGSPGDRRHLADLIDAHVALDTGFVALYGVLLYVVLAWIGADFALGTDWTPGWGSARVWRWVPRRWWELFLVIAVVADLTENDAIHRYATIMRDAGSDRIPPDRLIELLGWLTWIKWIAVGVLLVAAVRLAFLRWSRVGAGTGAVRVATALAVRRAAYRPVVWRRHRVQLTVVSVLALLVAVPAGGPLDQIPDVVRTMLAVDQPEGTGRVALRWGEVWPSLTTLVLLCAALAVAGRWAVPPVRRRRGPTHPAMLVAIGAGLLIVALVLWTTGPFGPVRFNAGVLAVPLTFLAAGLATILTPGPATPPEQPITVSPEEVGEAHTAALEEDAVRDRERERTVRAGRLLTVLPVAIAGLALIRAFLDPIVAGGIPAGAVRASQIFVAVGVVTVLAGPPLVYALLHRLTVGNAIHAIGAVLLAGVAVLIGLTAWHPLTYGPRLNVTGSLCLALTLATLVGGFVQRRVDARPPYEVAARLGFRRSPVFLVTIGVVVLAGFLNTDGGYHAIRRDAASATGAPFALRDAFAAWATNAAACTVGGAYGVGGRSAVPMVLVAAPGGGIRAAYWTARTLSRLEGAGGSACGRRRVFAASGVSGGSVGLLTHYVAGGNPGVDPEEDPVVALSRETPLAATTAALLFRDVPAGAFGISAGWDDRAAVLERAWEGAVRPLGATTLVRGLTPGPDPRAPGAWRPLLLFNGTEVATGCRMVVSPVRVVLSAAPGAPASCRDGAVDSRAGEEFVHGAVDFLSFRDPQDCAADADRDADVPATTAALLSARFPYVSPSAELFDCRSPGSRSPGSRLLGPGSPETSVRTADLDGGAAENSGLATILDLWRSLQPIVADYNRSKSGPVIVPLLVLADNHYASSVAPAAAERPRELSAPVGLLGATGVLSEQGVLEQRALDAFGGRPPGVGESEAENYPDRFVRIGPHNRPGVAAPLGWTLSDLTRADLQTQLDAAFAEPCTPDPPGVRGPRPPSCVTTAF